MAVGELELNEQASNWFDSATNSFKNWNGSSYDSKQRLFVGVANTGASTVSAVYPTGGMSACDSDMSAVISPIWGKRSQSFCIERSERAVAVPFVAAQTCANDGRRLCRAPEWQRACSVGTSLSSMTGNYEILADFAYYGYSAGAGSASCSDVNLMDAATAAAYRCCSDMGN